MHLFDIYRLIHWRLFFLSLPLFQVFFLFIFFFCNLLVHLDFTLVIRLKLSSVFSFSLFRLCLGLIEMMRFIIALVTAQSPQANQQPQARTLGDHNPPPPSERGTKNAVQLVTVDPIEGIVTY